MKNLPEADKLTGLLAAKHRVLMLGGLAIIAHGLARKTKDVDIWLEPMASPGIWADQLADCVSIFDCARFWSLGDKRYLDVDELAEEIENFGVVRVTGLDRDVDIFREPNELGLEDFDQVWTDFDRELAGGVRLPSEIDLYLSKSNTGRVQDLNDQLFLESKIKSRYRDQLPCCDLEEAVHLLSRFLDPEILQSALENPNRDVRELALKYLREFEAEGDPYSRDILAAWSEPG
jgi:hypothetical protein